MRRFCINLHSLLEGILCLIANMTMGEKTCSTTGSLPGLNTGSRLIGSTYIAITSPRVQDCVTSCLRQNRCHSFNYQSSNGQCELNDSNATIAGATNLKRISNWNHVSIYSWSQKLSGSCKGKLCGPNAFCISNNTGYSCQKVELCFDMATSSYHGPVNVTKTGRTCQRWDDTVPHEPVMYPDNLNPSDPALKQHENYCRPDGHNIPWCYTMDKDKRWEECYVPTC